MKGGAEITHYDRGQCPLQLQKAVEKINEKLPKVRTIEKIKELKGDGFIKMTVLPAETGWVKAATDVRSLNIVIVTDNYRIANVDKLIQLITEKLKYKERNFLCKFGQQKRIWSLIIIPKNSGTLHFFDQSKESRGYLSFIAGLYDLTVMPT